MEKSIPLPKATAPDVVAKLKDVKIADCCGGTRDSAIVLVGDGWHLLISAGSPHPKKPHVTSWNVVSTPKVEVCPFCGTVLKSAPVRRYHSDEVLDDHILLLLEKPESTDKK